MYRVSYLFMPNDKRKKDSSRATTLISRWMLLRLLSSLRREKLSCRCEFHCRHLELMLEEEQSPSLIHLIKTTRKNEILTLCRRTSLYFASGAVRSCRKIDISEHRKRNLRCFHWQCLSKTKQRRDSLPQSAFQCTYTTIEKHCPRHICGCWRLEWHWHRTEPKRVVWYNPREDSWCSHTRWTYRKLDQ